MEVVKLDGSDRDRGLLEMAVKGEATIFTANEFVAQLKEMAEGYQHLRLDLSEVMDFDSAGAQVVLALRREFSAGGRRFELIGAASAVTEVLNTYRVDLGTPQADTELA